MIGKIIERLSAKEKLHKNMTNDKTGVLSAMDKCSHLHYAECFKEAKEIVQEVAKEYETSYITSYMEQLLEAKRNCSEDNDCSECPFGQIEDRCILAELQTGTKDGGWIPVEKELPPEPKENPVFDNKPLELYLVTLPGTEYPFRAFWNGKEFTDGWGKLRYVTAWQPLPPKYEPKDAPYQKGE